MFGDIDLSQTRIAYFLSHVESSRKKTDMNVEAKPFGRMNLTGEGRRREVMMGGEYEMKAVCTHC